jgi:hypothetical protein
MTALTRPAGALLASVLTLAVVIGSPVVSPAMAGYVGLSISLPAPNAAGWYTTAVEGAIQVSSDDPYAYGFWYLNNQQQGGLSEGRNSIYIREDGNFTLKATAYHYDGTTKTSDKTVRVDQTTPFIALTGGPSDGSTVLINSQVSLTWKCSDTTSGVATCGASGRSPGTSLALDTTTLGVHTLSLIAKDNAGNQTTRPYRYTVVKPDTTAPVVSVTAPQPTGSNGIYNRSFTITASATDIAGDSESTSGRPVLSYSLNGGPVQATNTSTTQLPWGGDGHYVLSVTATDAAGNTSAPTLFEWDYDEIAPRIEVAGITEGQHVPLGSNIVPSPTCDDSSYSPGTWTSGVDICAVSPTRLDTSSAGEKQLTLISIDRAGNSTRRSMTYVVDQPSPGDGNGSTGTDPTPSPASGTTSPPGATGSASNAGATSNTGAASNTGATPAGAGQIKSTTVVRVKKIAKGIATLSITVSSPSVMTKGKVTLLEGKRKLTSAKLTVKKGASKATAMVKLPLKKLKKLKGGRYTVSVSYPGTPQLLGSIGTVRVKK